MGKNRNVRTDLAIESQAFIQQGVTEKADEETYPSGIAVETAGSGEVKVIRVKVTTKEGQDAIGKPIGNYVTVEVPRLRENDPDLFESACNTVASELKKVIENLPKATVLVVGLGNWNITPDALGPKVVSSLMVTRHLLEYMPDTVEKGIRPVCAVAPGVLGITGIETGEIVKGVVERVRPDLVIAIDALASRKMERVSTTVQITDTGISPGSGVGNKRMELSQAVLGVPVVAIGVPTVVDAATMANDTIDLVIDSLIDEKDEGMEFYTKLKSIDRDAKYEMIQEVLKPYVGTLIVTPKEIDGIIERVSKVVANGINMALHEGITLEDVNKFVGV